MEEEEEEGYETANEELEEKPLARDFIGSQYEWDITEWTGPEILPYKTRIENEKEIYYTPSAFPPSIEELRANSSMKFTPEQEGVYTGKEPNVQSTNINKMQNRYKKKYIRSCNYKKIPTLFQGFLRKESTLKIRQTTGSQDLGP